MFNAAAGGDTIVLSGTFGRAYLANRAFTSRVLIDASNAVFTDNVILDHVSSLGFRGGTFNIAANGNYAKAIAISGGSGIYIDGVTVNGSADGTYSQFGVNFQNTYNAQVTHGKFNGLYSAIGINAGSGFVARNTITGSTSDGIDISDSHGVLADSNTCAGGHPVAGAHPDCIQLWSVAGHPLQSDITVSNNIASGQTQGFTSFPGGGGGLRLTFTRNTVNSVFPQGVACYDCINSTISYNRVTTQPGATYQTTINVVGGSGNTVVGNSVGAYLDWPARSFAATIDPNAGSDALAETGPLLDSAVNLDSAPAVPEPSSWAMLIAGFAAVGIVRRRAAGGVVSVVA